MRATWSIYRAALAAGGVGFVIGCSSETPPTEPGGPRPLEPVRELTVHERAVAGASTAFGLSLLVEVHESESRPNLLISPLSASMALGMTMGGAVGATLDAMRTTLGFGGMSDADVNAAYRGLIAQLRARDPKVELGLANSLWYERSFPVKEPFIAGARQNFDAEVTGLNFSDPAAPRTISGWAEKETGGRIKNLVEQIDPLEKLFLVNAVYFKGPWTSPFEPQATRPGPFTRANGSVIDVPLMNRDGTTRHVRNAEVEAVELFYADSAFSMVVLMPAEGRSLQSLVTGLTPAYWETLLSSMQPGRILLDMPKFRFDYGKQLDAPLKRLGMEIAFTPRLADFTRIADRDDLYITRVQQKSFIDVHELGTEAAAATVVGVGVTSLPPSIRFTRPFLFAIRERSSGALLFVGKVGDPSAG